MKFIEYNVRVYANNDKYWRLNGKYHREDGPAIERADANNYWYLDGIIYTEKEFLAKISVKESVSCAGKVIVFEGKKYRLEEE